MYLLVIPMFQDIASKFEQEMLLGNSNVVLKIYWVERAKAWFFDFRIPDTGEVVLGIRIIPQWPLLRQYKAVIPSFLGDLFVGKVDSNADDELTFENLNNEGWALYYITDDELEEWEASVGI